MTQGAEHSATRSVETINPNMPVSIRYGRPVLISGECIIQLYFISRDLESGDISHPRFGVFGRRRTKIVQKGGNSHLFSVES